jgi:type IX secretion system PorP/SprF family membrane protein
MIYLPFDQRQAVTFFTMKTKIIIFLLLSPCYLLAQVNNNFSQFFINPYLYNPSFAGADAQSAVFLSYRNQWTGFEGAPSIGNVSFHTPAGKNVGLGLNFTNEQRSILQTSSAQLSLSYAFFLGESSFFRFGISGGGAFSGVDITEIEDPSDPAFANIMENNIYLIGNAGMSLQLKTFNIGIAVPNLFTEQYVTTENFSVGEIEPLEQLIISASNRFYFGGGKHIFEPAVLYRYSDILPPQLEAAGVFHLNHVVWVGGSYKEDFGISAFGGLKVKQKLGIGYSYSLASSGINEINRPTHEIHLSLLLGEKNENRVRYSFLNSEKEKRKPVRKPVVAKKEEPVVEEPVVEEEIAEEPELAEEPEIAEPAEPVTSPEATGPVTVKRGGHMLELETGTYVIVGAFSTYDSAERYSDELFFKGYPTRFGYISERGLWYVYHFRSDNAAEAREERDKVRKNKIFSEAWILTVEK